MEYLIAYTVLGVIFLGVSFSRGMPDKEHRVSGSIFLFVFWPLLVLIVGKEFLFPVNEESIPENNVTLRKSLSLLENEESLSDDEKNSIKNTIVELENEITSFARFSQIEASLNEFWRIELHPKLYFDYLHGKKRLEEPEADSGVRFSIKAPDWYIGFSNEFLKSIKGIDKKLQGRVLESLKVISESPLELNGNTVKPLGKQLKGLWRYRIGDYRLLYKPDSESKLILILRFSHRKEVYEGNLEIVT